jgi:rubrerythrin
MIEFNSSLTAKNIMQAFTLESQAIQKYLWFAKVATKEGFQQIAEIFTQTAEQKKSHCKNLYRFLEGCEVEFSSSAKAEKIGTTLENLKAAAEAENYQHSELYAQFEQTARTEEFIKAATKLKLFRQIKKFYANRFEQFANNIEAGIVFTKDKKVKWVCRKCGYIYEGETALQNCPACEHPQAYFEILAENY